jgi:transposase
VGYDRKIRELYRNSEICQRLGKVEGIGPVTATALVAAVCDRGSFKNGRQFAAWLGLMPKQRSSGGRARLFGISKRGDRYLRTLLSMAPAPPSDGFEKNRIQEACG